jgi:hypothetical protein
MPHAGIAGTKRRANQFVTIQVNEADSVIPKVLAVAAFNEHQLCVALVSGPFRHQDHFRAKAPEALGSRHDQQRVRVDGLSENVIHQVWLENNHPPPYIKREKLEPAEENFYNLFGVFVHMENCYA